MTDDLEPMSVDVPTDADLEAGVIEPPTTDGAAAPRDDGDLALLGLIDRLATLLDRSDLTELEVESGGTGLVLRKPSALTPITVTSLSAASPAATPEVVPGIATGEPSTAGREPAVAARPSVKAPLTGIYYASPAPGSAPYVSVGGEVAVGQVIGLIEAMKLFNEIKSDLAGRVVRVVAESGTLVKAKQPLIEVEPL
jgi:acetyl-CoA carboxylase biotin carboxyl carrier protein